MKRLIYTSSDTNNGTYTYDQFIDDCIAQVEWSYKLGAIKDPYDVDQIGELIEKMFPEDVVWEFTSNDNHYLYDIRNNLTC